MMRKKLASAAIGAALSACVIGPIALQTGKGPLVHFISIKPLGPGRAGGVLPLLIDSKIREGCIPLVARSLTRLIMNHDGRIQTIKFPLTNAPLVTYDPVPPADLVKQYGFDHRKIVPIFLPLGLPNSDDYGTPLMIHGNPEPWRLQTDSVPSVCSLGDLFRNTFSGQTIGARDIPVELVVPPKSAVVQPPKG